MHFDANIKEEELKNLVREQLFPAPDFDATPIIGSIDFCVTVPKTSNQPELFDRQYLYWAEAKKGVKDPIASVTQLIGTIGKEKLTMNNCPPSWIGAFDSEKIVFMPFADVNKILARSDIDWVHLTPSDHQSDKFKHLYDIVKPVFEKENCKFCFETEEKMLRNFISKNLRSSKSGQIEINRDNFIYVYHQWLKTVKDTIVMDWDKLKEKNGLFAADFFLADILSDNNITLKEDLNIILQTNHYCIKKGWDPDLLSQEFAQVSFKDGQKAHKEFWKKYKRPPRKEFQDKIIDRRDLLLPQDIREVKGSFFTPQQWVSKSQEYLTAVLPKDWRDNWYIWDCCAGTGNLLVGDMNEYHVWASTLDQADVSIMKDRCKNGARLLEKHVFQFDFLNDEFSKLPDDLKKIIGDPEKRKRLLIYINPPYAEAASKKTVAKTGKNKTGVSVKNATYDKLAKIDGVEKAKRELFVQFLYRIYNEIPGCMIGCFSTLKLLQGPSFEFFHSKVFPAKLEKLFICPANSFDNVKGKFPIGFHIWNTTVKEDNTLILADVYDAKANKIGTRLIRFYDGKKLITDWLKSFRKKNLPDIGFISSYGNDIQHCNYIYIVNDRNQIPYPVGSWVNRNNLIPACIYYSVRHAIPATWINDRDQFYWPEDTWMNDMDFISDCLMYTVANLNISAEVGVNHWLPFRESKVGAPDNFRSNFLADFIEGKLSVSEKGPEQKTLFDEEESDGSKKPVYPTGSQVITFSKEAERLRSALAAMYQYYYKQPNKFVGYVDPSYYDIRTFFCGRNAKKQLKTESDNEEFNRLRDKINEAKEAVRQKIEEGVYRHGFRRADELVVATNVSFPEELDFDDESSRVS